MREPELGAIGEAQMLVSTGDLASALGADPVLISFNANDDSYSCKPQALEVRVDLAEDQAAGVVPVPVGVGDEADIRARIGRQ